MEVIIGTDRESIISSCFQNVGYSCIADRQRPLSAPIHNLTITKRPILCSSCGTDLRCSLLQ